MVSSTSTTDRHYVTEILLKVALNTSILADYVSFVFMLMLLNNCVRAIDA